MSGASRLALLAAINMLSFAPLAHAGPDDYVAVPGVEYGEREIELRLGTASATDEHRQSAASLAFGYGVTPWWSTEVYGKWHRSGATSFDAFEWENRFQLTEPGRYFADFGLLVEIERPRDRGCDGEATYRFLVVVHASARRTHSSASLRHHSGVRMHVSASPQSRGAGPFGPRLGCRLARRAHSAITTPFAVDSLNSPTNE